LSERRVTFTREQIAAYAEASGDHNPIHLDDEFARSVGLPSLIAHGMLQMGIAATVAAEAAGGPANLRRMSVRFAGLVVPGDEVTFTAEAQDQGKLDIKAVNQRGEAVLTKAVAEYAIAPPPSGGRDEGRGA
jgi:acyl dehydratase